MSAARRPELTGLRLADPPERWGALGFSVVDSQLELGGIRVELEAPGRGVVSWRLRGAEPLTSIDGLATEADKEPAPAGTQPHPNRALGVDHVVVVTPRFDRTARALEQAGMPLRRIRETSGGVRQGFRRLGPAILELVEARDPDDGPARFWGLVVIVSDLEVLADRLGDRLGSVTDAVQPGRRIATLKASAGLGEAVAFMTPEPG